MTQKPPEFHHQRAIMYHEALIRYPDARSSDIETMTRLLNPKAGDKILGIGEGNGFFVPAILNGVKETGEYIVTDPSQYQLDNLRKVHTAKNLHAYTCGAQDSYELQKLGNSFSKIWSFGAFHHCPAQDVAFRNFYSALKPNGLLVICDVWRNTSLSEHFDGPVAKYCSTGHDVKFLGDTYARTISEKAGFKEIQIVNLPLQWKFKSKKDAGIFLFYLHSMTGLFEEGNTLKQSYAKVTAGLEKCLGFIMHPHGVSLNWPMKAIIAKK